MMKFFFAEFLYSSKISVSEDGISGISPEDGISISESSEEEVVRIFFFPEVIKETDFNLAPRELVRDFGFSDSTEEERGLIIELALCDFFCDFVGVVDNSDWSGILFPDSSDWSGECNSIFPRDIFLTTELRLSFLRDFLRCGSLMSSLERTEIMGFDFVDPFVCWAVSVLTSMVIPQVALPLTSSKNSKSSPNPNSLEWT